MYLKKLGISAEKWIEVADETDDTVPQDARERVALFGVLAVTIELDKTTYHKYSEALKAIRQDAEVRWENHEFWYIRTEIGSTTYMEGLAAGYKVVDSEGKVRIMDNGEDEDGHQRGHGETAWRTNGGNMTENLGHPYSGLWWGQPLLCWSTSYFFGVRT